MILNLASVFLLVHIPFTGRGTVDACGEQIDLHRDITTVCFPLATLFAMYSGILQVLCLGSVV